MFFAELAVAVFPIIIFGGLIFLIPTIHALTQYPEYKQSGGKKSIKKYLIDYLKKV